MPKNPLFWLSVAVVAAVGIAVELGVGKPGREAWDSEQYWSAGLPAMLAAAFVVGFIAKQQPWIVGYAPFAAQAVTMAAESGEFSMLPLGLILLGVIGLSGVIAAFSGAYLGKRLFR